MRGTKAKKLRRQGLEKPGRKHGGRQRKEYRESIKKMDQDQATMAELLFGPLKKEES